MHHPAIPRSARYRGALLGLAAGDALGTTLEFKPPGSFAPIDDMVGGGPFRLAPGTWTDDTSMALCLAESLVECGGFDPVDQLERYVRWYRDGHMSATGDCFDIGATVRAALHRFEETREPWCGSDDSDLAGNGSLMRLAPVPLAFAADVRKAVQHAAESSRTTHAAREPVDACRYFAALLVGALRGAPKEDLLAGVYEPERDLWREAPLAPAIARVASGSFWQRDPPEVKGTGYVVDSLEAALWAFSRSTNFREGALLAVNLGHDADTTGAIYGQLAGAYYGDEGIPTEWRERLVWKDRIVAWARALEGMAEPEGGE